MNETQRAEDAYLAGRLLTREEGAWPELIRCFDEPLRYYAAKLVGPDVAPDVMQEVWIRAFKTIRSLKEPRALRAWLYRLTRGIAVDHARKRGRYGEVREQYAAEPADDAHEPTFDAFDALAIHNALDSLSFEHREVLVLHFLEELTVAELSAAIDVPPGTVKSRLYHAKRGLRAALEEMGYE